MLPYMVDREKASLNFSFRRQWNNAEGKQAKVATVPKVASRWVANTVITAPLLPVMAGFMMVYGGYSVKNRIKWREKIKMNQAHNNKPLRSDHSQLRRSLTLQSDGTVLQKSPRQVDIRSAVNPQYQCLILQLPVELQLHIYEYVFDCSSYAIWRNEWGWTPANYRMGYNPRSYGALIRTCKAMYAISIDTMYAHTIFEFTYQNQKVCDELLTFRKSILPQRWQTIRSLVLTFSFSKPSRFPKGYRREMRLYQRYRAKGFSKICVALATLSSLQNLYVCLEDPCGVADLVAAREALSMIKIPNCTVKIEREEDNGKTLVFVRSRAITDTFRGRHYQHRRDGYETVLRGYVPPRPSKRSILCF